MNKEENNFLAILASMETHRDEVQEAFKSRADSTGRLTAQGTSDMLDDLSVILSFDFENAKKFYSLENKKIPEDYNIKSLRFQEFIEILHLWIRQESQRYTDLAKSSFISGNSADRTKGMVDNAFRANTQGVTRSKTRLKTAVGLPPNYQANKKLLDDLVKEHRDEWKEIFTGRLMEEGQDRVAIFDIFNVLQEWFYLDQIDVMGRASDPEDFFQSLNSYKKLFSIAEEYYLNEKKISPVDFEIKEKMISFEECLEMLYHWIKTDEYVVLIDNRVKDEAGAVKKALLATIENYEQMFEDAKTEIEKQVLQTTIDTLYKKLEELETGIIKTERNKIDEAELKRRAQKRKRAFKEIFYFYCTQQINLGSAQTFDKLGRLTNTINLGTYKVLLKNFRLKIQHHKLVELYRKSAGQDENLSLEEFEDLMYKVALRAEIAGVEKVHETHYEIMKDYKPDSYKNDKTYKNFKEQDAKRREEEIVKTSIVNKAKAIYSEQKKRDDEKLEEIWEHLGLYNGEYKKKISMVRLPFDSHDKQNFRIPPESLTYKFRVKALEGKTVDEIRDEVNRRNELRYLIRELKGIEKSNLHQHKSVSPSKEPAYTTPSREPDGYGKKNAGKGRNRVPEFNKLTLKKIEQLLYGDVKRVDEDFNPHDLIDENDEEDNQYLGEYNLSVEKKQMRAENEAEKRKLDEYGKLKKVSKGFAINGKYGVKSLSPPRRMEIDTETYSVSTSNNYGNYAYNQTPQHYMNAYPPANMGLPRGVPQSTKNLKGPSYLDYDIHSQVNSMKSPKKPQSYIPYTANLGGSPGAYPPMYANSGNGYYHKSYSDYSHTLDRADQIENDMRRREQNTMNSVMNIQNHQMNKGLKAAKY